MRGALVILLLALVACGDGGTNHGSTRGVPLPEPTLFATAPMTLCAGPRIVHPPDDDPAGLCVLEAEPFDLGPCDDACDELVGRSCRCGRCVIAGCRAIEDCPEGTRCDEGLCVPMEPVACTADADCAVGQGCDDGVCAALGCDTDAQCGEGRRCEATRAQHHIDAPAILEQDPTGVATRILLVVDGALWGADRRGEDDFDLDAAPLLSLPGGAFGGATLLPSGELVAASADGATLHRAEAQPDGSYALDAAPLGEPALPVLGRPEAIPGSDFLLLPQGEIACALEGDSAIRVGDALLCDNASGAPRCCRNGLCCDPAVGLSLGERRLARELRLWSPSTSAPLLSALPLPAAPTGDSGYWDSLLAVTGGAMLGPRAEQSEGTHRLWFTGLAKEAGDEVYHLSVGYAALEALDAGAVDLHPFNPVLDVLRSFVTHLHERAPAVSDGAERAAEILFIQSDGRPVSRQLARGRY